MAYGTITTLQDLIAQFVISASSVPNTTQATSIIADVSNEIDTALSARGLSVPVAAPAFFVAWLGRLNAYGAAAAVLKSALPDSSGPSDTPAYAFWEERYQAGIQGIRDGSMIPDAAAVGGNFVMPSTYLTRNADSEEALGDIAEPFFKVGTNF